MAQHWFKRCIKLVTAIALMCTLNNAYAVFKSPCQNDDPCWHNTFAAYAWIFGQDGNIRFNGQDVDISVTVGDVLENLDLINFILQLHLETSNGTWSFFIDPTVLKIASTNTLDTPPIAPEVTARASTGLTLVDFAAAYTLTDHCMVDCGRCGWLKIEAYGGGRNMYFDTSVDLGNPIEVSDSANWLMFMAGLRGTWQVCQDVSLWARLDGSIGSLSTSWGAQGYLGYHFNKNAFIALGARYLDFCGRKGAGSNRLVMDVDYFGPVLGLGVNW